MTRLFGISLLIGVISWEECRFTNNNEQIGGMDANGKPIVVEID